MNDSEPPVNTGFRNGRGIIFVHEEGCFPPQIVFRESDETADDATNHERYLQALRALFRAGFISDREFVIRVSFPADRV